MDSKEIKLVNPKESNPEYSLEGWLLKLKHQYFGHLMGRANSLEKSLMLGKIEGRKRRRRHSLEKSLLLGKIEGRKRRRRQRMR